MVNWGGNFSFGIKSPLIKLSKLGKLDKLGKLGKLGY